MDFFEFKKQYGVSEDCLGSLSDTAILKFNLNQKDKLSTTYQGKPVFMNWNYENTIQPGDIWICSLELNSKNGTNYFAIPLEKIDSSFLYGMHMDQLREFALEIWYENRAILESELTDVNKDIIDSKVAEGVSRNREEFETEVAELNARIEELERTNEEKDALIKNLREDILSLVTPKEHVQNDIPKHVTMTMPDRRPVFNGVLRVDANTIESGLLTQSRYRVHTTAKQDRIVIRPDNNGKVVCKNNRVVLNGLEVLVPFDGECQLRYVTIDNSNELRIFLA